MHVKIVMIHCTDYAFRRIPTNDDNDTDNRHGSSWAAWVWVPKHYHRYIIGERGGYEGNVSVIPFARYTRRWHKLHKLSHVRDISISSIAL